MAVGDFHLHSTMSDGVASPAHVVEMAAQAGVRWMALTDHDTTDGLAEAATAAAARGIRLMPGIELSTDMDGVDCHLLAYGMRWQDPALQAFLAQQRDNRLGRLDRMLAVLAAEGVPVEKGRVLEIAGESSVGRPHVARALVERGHVGSVAAAFDLWLGNGKVADVPREKLSPAEAIAMVHGHGGVVFAAHPPFLGDDFPEQLRNLAEDGLDGIETYYRHYDPVTVDAIAALAAELGCATSGGSDYHGLGNPNDRPVGAIPFADEDVAAFVGFCEARCAVPWVEETIHVGS